MRRTALPSFLVAFIFLLVGLLLSFVVGRYPVSLGDVLHVVFAKLAGRAADVPPAVESVIWQVRRPRVIAAALVGAALAVAGNGKAPGR